MLVYRCRVQSYRLVVRHVAPALAFAGEQLGVEAPGNDRIDHRLIDAVIVVFFGDGEEVALATAASGSVCFVLAFILIDGEGLAGIDTGSMIFSAPSRAAKVRCRL